MVLVLAICSLQVSNFVWFWWVFHASLRMPEVYKKHSKAMLGFGGQLVSEMKGNALQMKEKVKQWQRARAEAKR